MGEPNLIRFRSARRYWEDGVCRLAKPFAAKACPPDWYKDLERYVKPEGPKNLSMSIKMCPPFLEALTHGYILPVPFDFSLSKTAGRDGFEQRVGEGIDEKWAPVLGPADVSLFRGSPWEGGVVRLRNYWTIETPPGFSCLLISPLNRGADEVPFEILPTMVETDKEGGDAEILAALRRPLAEEIQVKGGVPLVQVIPIAREGWRHALSIWDKEKVEEIVDFRSRYWDPKNRRFDEGADPARPDEGWGAYHKLVKVPTRFK